MISWLKRHFIPHHGNGHRPHILRGETARMAVVGVLVVELVMFILPAATSLDILSRLNTAEVLSGALNAFTNEKRLSTGLAPLAPDELLTRAAEMKAADMAEKGYFAHTSPEGKTPWYWLDLAGYPYQYAGENLAINFNDSKDVTEAWMNSPAHRANIEKGVYTEIGTGVATGIYQGREAVFVAQVYANPAPRAQAPVPAAAKTAEPEAPRALSDAAPAETVVLGAETAVANPVPEEAMPDGGLARVSLFDRMMAAPQHALESALIVLLAVFIVGVGLKLAVRSHIKHRDLITNGLAVIAIIVGALFVNDFLSAKNVVLTQTFEYSQEQAREAE